MSQCAGADWKITEPPQEAHDFGGSGAESEAGEMDLGCLFDGLSHPAEARGGETQAGLSPGVEAVGTDTQSAPQSVVSGMLGVTAEGTPDSAGEVEVSSSVECNGGREQAASLLGPDTVDVCSRSESPVLTAAASSVCVPKKGSVPSVCAAPLLAKVGVDGEEAEVGRSL